VVLYNSPYAVAALLIGVALAIFGLMRLARAFRAPAQSEDEHTKTIRGRDRAGLSPVLRDLLNAGMRDAALVIIGILLLMGVLTVAVLHDLGP